MARPLPILATQHPACPCPSLAEACRKNEKAGLSSGQSERTNLLSAAPQTYASKHTRNNCVFALPTQPPYQNPYPSPVTRTGDTWKNLQLFDLKQLANILTRCQSVFIRLRITEVLFDDLQHPLQIRMLSVADETAGQKPV